MEPFDVCVVRRSGQRSGAAHEHSTICPLQRRDGGSRLAPFRHGCREERGARRAPAGQRHKPLAAWREGGEAEKGGCEPYRRRTCHPRCIRHVLGRAVRLLGIANGTSQPAAPALRGSGALGLRGSPRLRRHTPADHARMGACGFEASRRRHVRGNGRGTCRRRLGRAAAGLTNRDWACDGAARRGTLWPFAD